MKIAVSACLLGQEVSFDGGHRRDRFITDQLSKYASFVSFCPEVKAFGIPRASVRIINKDKKLTIVSNKTGDDVTQILKEKNKEELQKLKSSELSGIIFKAKSPSCAFGSAKVYLPNGFREGKTDGFFASSCKQAFKYLPIEEESRLRDGWLRENFIMQLFAYDRFEKFKHSNPKIKDLIDFHSRHKFLLQSKDEILYRKLGKIVGNHQEKEFSEILYEYEWLFKECIAVKSSIKKTRNVLEHMAGFLKKVVHKTEKEMLVFLIKDYADGIIPLITPVSMIQMLAKRYEVDYLLNQYFLEPYPRELALRSDLKAGK